jgi:hypothetical protein
MKNNHLDNIAVRCFQLGFKQFLHCFFTMTDAHCRCNFISAISFIVLDMLINLLLNLNTLQSMATQNTNQQHLSDLLRIIHRLHSGTYSYNHWTVILLCISLVFICSDHKKWITDHYCSLVHSVNGETMLNKSQYYHNSNDNENKICAKEGMFILFTPSTTKCYKHFLWGKLKLYLLLTFPRT